MNNNDLDFHLRDLSFLLAALKNMLKKIELSKTNRVTMEANWTESNYSHVRGIRQIPFLNYHIARGNNDYDNTS